MRDRTAATAPDVTGTAGPLLLERSAHLEALHEARRDAAAGHGGVVVLLGGEAGAGKTALLRRFGTQLPAHVRLAWGACDPLFTPRPLGPFADIADAQGGELAAALHAGAKPYEVAALLARRAVEHPGDVLVLEDLHWADEASLDVLNLLARRITSVPALIVVTYRDHELDRTHPLRTLIGELPPTAAIRRLTTEPLSAGAVTALAAPFGLDAAALHRATGGNAFFLSEILAAGDHNAGIPPTVRDAVLARIARCSRDAAAIVEAASVAVPRAELWLLEALAPGAAGALDECLRAGILQTVGGDGEPGAVAFRHELARMAVAATLPAHRRRTLHRAVLAALAAPPSGRPDPARLAHHAEAGEDAEAVLAYAPAAAAEAAAKGAHREAASHYRRALPFGGRLAADARAELLENLSYEDYLCDAIDESVSALREAIALRRRLGDTPALAGTISTLSRRLYCAGRVNDAVNAAEEALGLLQDREPGPELALAHSNLGQMFMNDERFEETVAASERAIELAAKFDLVTVTVHSLNNLGTAQLLAGHTTDGLDNLLRSLELATQAGLEEHVGRAYIHLGWAAARSRAADIEPWLDRGVATCQELGLEAWRHYVIVHRSRVHLNRGRWAAAADDAAEVLATGSSVAHLRIFALSTLGLVLARRGDPDGAAMLDEARTLLAAQHELQYHGPTATARAEAAWLSGRNEEVASETAHALRMATERGAAMLSGELAWLRRLAGVVEDVGGTGGPYALALDGDLRGAAAAWQGLGCPYDAALVLVASADEDDLREALATFQSLDARPAAAIAARRLRSAGVRGIPRGPRPATREHPAHLTRREVEVLALIREGAANAEIAARLYLSEKTVHHHVSAILRKLDVATRAQAVSAAARRGLA